jgi:hypothetical protein
VVKDTQAEYQIELAAKARYVLSPVQAFKIVLEKLRASKLIFLFNALAFAQILGPAFDGDVLSYTHFFKNYAVVTLERTNFQHPLIPNVKKIGNVFETLVLDFSAAIV